MSFLGGGGRWPDGSDRDARPVREHFEERRTVGSTRLGTGTLACPGCDAPVAVGPQPLRLADGLQCPFCAHAGPVRDFLSLAPPTRPARVAVHLHASWRRPLRTD